MEIHGRTSLRYLKVGQITLLKTIGTQVCEKNYLILKRSLKSRQENSYKLQKKSLKAAV